MTLGYYYMELRLARYEYFPYIRRTSSSSRKKGSPALQMKGIHGIVCDDDKTAAKPQATEHNNDIAMMCTRNTRKGGWCTLSMLRSTEALTCFISILLDPPIYKMFICLCRSRKWYTWTFNSVTLPTVKKEYLQMFVHTTKYENYGCDVTGFTAPLWQFPLLAFPINKNQSQVHGHSKNFYYALYSPLYTITQVHLLPLLHWCSYFI